MPDDDTVALFSTWRRPFERFPCASSPAYHAFLDIFRWPAQPVDEPLPIRPRWLVEDLAEGRPDTSALL